MTTSWRRFSSATWRERPMSGSAGTIASIAKAFSAMSSASIAVSSRAPGRRVAPGGWLRSNGMGTALLAQPRTTCKRASTERGGRVRESRVTVRLIGLPTDSHSSFLRGPASAPAAIRDALWSPHGNAAAENGFERGDATRLVQVGIRTSTRHCREQGEKYGIETIEMRDFDPATVPIPEAPLYISIDLDGLDPAFAPGVSHHEPGGLSVRDILSVLQRVHGPIVGADVVELNPARDINGMTAVVAAKFVKELAAVAGRGR